MKLSINSHEGSAIFQANDFGLIINHNNLNEEGLPLEYTKLFRFNGQSFKVSLTREDMNEILNFFNKTPQQYQKELAEKFGNVRVKAIKETVNEED